MRIFTKKAFIFFNKSEEDKAIVTKALAFDDVPDWVKKDPTYKAGLADGDIEVIVTREQQIKAEKGIIAPTPAPEVITSEEEPGNALPNEVAVKPTVKKAKK